MIDDSPGCFLVVDDDEMNRDMLSRRLRKSGYDVDVAADGYEALERIAARPFDLVILDVMMPGLDGLGVLKAVREIHGSTDLPIIMATAKDKSEDIIIALELGANDYVIKPLDFPVVLARIKTQLTLKRSMQQIRTLEQSLILHNSALVAANNRMSSDLKAAARIQEALLPSRTPSLPGVSFAWDFRPCDELAGDGLNVIQLDATHVALYVLDVSGHGVASALLSVSISRVLSSPADPSSILVDHDGDLARPADVANQLNEMFPFDLATEQYFTLVYGILDVGSGEFSFISAGHPGPVLVTAAGEPELLDGRGYPIGLAEDGYTEQVLRLEPGDRLYLYSDGVPEAMGADRELFGNDRLLEGANRLRSTPLSEAVTALRVEVEAWCESFGFRDDVSILAVEMSNEETGDDVRNTAAKDSG